MSSISLPKTTVNIVGANTVVPNTAQRILVVGQKLAGGSAASGALLEDLAINDEENQFFAGSMLAKMIQAIKEVNKVTPIDVIPLDDNGAGVQATATVTVAGTLSAFSDVSVIVAGTPYTVAIDATISTVTLLADAFVALITADLASLITASNIAGVITLVAKNDGTLGNSISVETNDTDESSGYILTVTAGFTGGATDPSVSGILSLVGTKRYQTIIWPYGAQPDVDQLVTFLDARFNLSNQVLDGVGITALIDSAANAATVAGVLNSNSIVMLLDEQVSETDYVGPSVSSYLPTRISLVGGIRSLRLSAGANISRFVISSFGARDSFGGPALASKPYFNTPLPGLALIGTGRGYSQTEVELINNNGGTVIGNGSSNRIILGQVVTTYLTDSAGNADISFKFLNFVDTASNAREYFFNNLKSRFAQSRLTNGDVIAGRDQANAETIAAFTEKLYQDLSGPDFVLVETGETAVKFFKDNLVVVIDTSIGKATITMQVPIVTQLREIVATMQITFSSDE